MKQCTRCGRLLAFSCFWHQKGGRLGYRAHCTACVKEHLKKRRERLGDSVILAGKREYYARRKEHFRKKKADWYRKHRDRILPRRRVVNRSQEEVEQMRFRDRQRTPRHVKRDLLSAEQREKIRAADRSRYRRNRKKRVKQACAYVIERRRRDVRFRLLGNLRTRISTALRRGGAVKTTRTEALLGCTVAEARQHIAGLFKPGMSWGNYGRWHIDHKRPCAFFDLTHHSQQQQCFHYTNLQPLWAADNIRKGKKVDNTISVAEGSCGDAGGGSGTPTDSP